MCKQCILHLHTIGDDFPLCIVRFYLRACKMVHFCSSSMSHTLFKFQTNLISKLELSGKQMLKMAMLVMWWWWWYSPRLAYLIRAQNHSSKHILPPSISGRIDFWFHVPCSMFVTYFIHSYIHSLCVSLSLLLYLFDKHRVVAIGIRWPYAMSLTTISAIIHAKHRITWVKIVHL